VANFLAAGIILRLTLLDGKVGQRLGDRHQTWPRFPHGLRRRTRPRLVAVAQTLANLAVEQRQPKK